MSNVFLAKAEASLEISLATKRHQASGCKGHCFAQTDIDFELGFRMRFVVNLNQLFHGHVSVDLRG
jgi:hypothetical protein